MPNQNVDEIFTELSKISNSVVCCGMKCNNCIARMDNKSQWYCLFNNFDESVTSGDYIRPEVAIPLMALVLQRLRCNGVDCDTCPFKYIEEDTVYYRCKVTDVYFFFRDLGVIQ